MGNPEYYKKREEELKNHHCAYRDSYAYKSTLVDKKDRQLNACDALHVVIRCAPSAPRNPLTQRSS